MLNVQIKYYNDDYDNDNNNHICPILEWQFQNCCVALSNSIHFHVGQVI
jgi:hypothetical protein